MPRPMIGIGHSMGAAQITGLSILHPRLFETIILIDPVIQNFEKIVPNGNMIPAHLSAARRDRWPNRKAAEQSFKKSKFYKTWDPRVLDLWVQWGLRELPTKTYTEDMPGTDPYAQDGKEVTLTTTKAQEVFSFLRPIKLASWGGNEEALTKEEQKELYESVFVDVVPAWEKSATFYRLEPSLLFNMLGFVRPTVLYIFGEHSVVCPPAARKAKFEATGIAISGSGGAKKGKVKEIVIKDTGHLVAMEKVEDTADAIAPWVEETLSKWKRTEELLKKYWAGVSEKDQMTLSAKRLKVFEGGEKFGMGTPAKEPKSKI
jgi:pimeloyl-ACP methyl ester carboxylesterase